MTTTKVIHTRATEAKNTVAKITKNVIEFTQAASLIILCVIGGIVAKQGTISINGIYAYIVAAAVAIVAIIAGVMLVRHFNK